MTNVAQVATQRSRPFRFFVLKIGTALIPQGWHWDGPGLGGDAVGCTVQYDQTKSNVSSQGVLRGHEAGATFCG